MYITGNTPFPVTGLERYAGQGKGETFWVDPWQRSFDEESPQRILMNLMDRLDLDRATVAPQGIELEMKGI